MPQDMWGGQGTTWEGGRVAIWGHWFPPSTIYISQIWTEVISLGSKLLTLRVTSVAPWSLFFCSTLLWHPAFSDRVVAAGTTVMASKGKVRAVIIELCLPWSAAPAAGVLVCTSQREFASVSISQVWGHSQNSYIWPYKLPSPNLSCAL